MKKANGWLVVFVLATMTVLACGGGSGECTPACGPAFECYLGACVPRGPDSGHDGTIEGGADGDAPPRDDGTNVDTPDVRPEGGCTGPEDCADGDPCTQDLCDPSTGICHNPPAPEGTPCTDGNACTTSDRCSGGACTGTPMCDDGNACTDDPCNPATGACTFTANSAPCEDGNPCTTSDRCSGGACWPGAGLPAWYPDADGDGFGSPSGTPVCAASVPVGYADNTQDCCDADGRVRPDQTAYFANSYTCGAGSSFDYNCNGVEEQRWSETGGGCRWGTMSCVETVGWQGGDVPACGVSRSWVSGCSSYSCSPTVESRTQECR